MKDTESDTSSSEEEVAVVKQSNQNKKETDQTEIITIDPNLISKIKLNKVQVRQLKTLQRELVTGPKPIDPVKEDKKAEAKIRRDKVKAEKVAVKTEQVRLAKLAEEEAKKVAELKSKYITFKVPIYKYIKKDKVAVAKVTKVAKEAITADDEDGDNDETSEEEKPKALRRRRFQKEKVELDTSDEERVAKLESIDKALQTFTFAPRRRTFF